MWIKGKLCNIHNAKFTSFIVEKTTDDNEIRGFFFSLKTQKDIPFFILVLHTEPYLFFRGSNSLTLPFKGNLGVTASGYIEDLGKQDIKNYI